MRRLVRNVRELRSLTVTLPRHGAAAHFPRSSRRPFDHDAFHVIPGEAAGLGSARIPAANAA